MGKSSSKRRPIDVASEIAYRGLVAAALLAPIVTYLNGKPRKKSDRESKARRKEDASKALDDTLRAVCALGAGRLASETLKRVIPEKRPDSTDNKSFPSAHSAATLAAAEAAATNDPAHAGLWYTGAGVLTALRASS